MRFDRVLPWLSIIGLPVIFSLCAVSAYPQVEPERERSFSLTDPKYDRIVVAKVGNVKITAQEFLLNYEFGPAFPKRRNNSKLQYLNFMVNEKLFALDGYARGLQRSQRLLESLAEIEGDLATEELYKQDVAPNVAVTDQEIAEGIRKKRLVLSLRWIFSLSDSGIARYRQLLTGGAAFDSVFALQLRDSVRFDDRSLRTTRFDLAMNNPVLAGIVDSLPVGAVSPTIHVEDGWYIVRLDDTESSPIMTQTEEERLHEDVHRALVQQESDRLSDQYVHEIMVDAKPVIERRAFDIVQTYLAKRILPPGRFAQWDMEDVLTKKWGSVDYSNIEPFKKHSLVTCRRGTLTVSDFFLWYDARSANLHLSASSARAFFASLEGYVWRMVRDKLLTWRALKKRMQFRDAVQKQKKWWEEKILYDLEKSLLSDSILTDSLTLKEYYASHQREYRDSTGKVKPYPDVSEDVGRAYFSSVLTERMLHRIIALKSRYRVTINEAALDSLAVDIENQPRAIDVYAVKKGGTFPRPAFPTIDYGWQTWY